VVFFLSIVEFFLQCKNNASILVIFPQKNIKEAIEGYIEVSVTEWTNSRNPIQKTPPTKHMKQPIVINGRSNDPKRISMLSLIHYQNQYGRSYLIQRSHADRLRKK
jgi:hypothetical protein